jgi:hypothetical protein
MKKFTPSEARIETVSALAMVRQGLAAEEYAAYVGLDVVVPPSNSRFTGKFEGGYFTGDPCFSVA